MSAAALDDMVCMAFTLADRAAVCDIESYGVQEYQGGMAWFDIRPMIDDREHAPVSIDMAIQAVCYAKARGLVVQHPQHEHLLRVVWRP